MTIRDIAIAIGYNVDNKSYDQAMASVNKFASFAKKILGAVAVGALFNQARKQVEHYMQINNQLAYAVDYMQDMAALQEKIMTAAQNSNTSYDSMASAVKQMVQDTNAWTLSLDDATSLVETLGKVFRGAGLGRDEAGGLVEQFAQNFANGRLTNLSQMLAAAPELVNYLAKTLNTTNQAIRAMAMQNNITLKEFTRAIYNNLDDIEDRYSRISLTITDSLAYVKERFFLWLSSDGRKIVNDIALKIRQFGDKLGPKLNKVRDVIEALGGLPSLFGKVAAIAASITLFSKGVEFISKLKQALPSITSAFGSGGAAGAAGGAGASSGSILGMLGKISWILAVIYLAIKTVADIVAFARGEDSLTEEAYRERGQDPDAARQTLLSALNDMKKELAPLGQALLDLWNNVKDIFGSVLKTSAITTIDFLKTIVPLVSTIAKSITFALKIINTLINTIGKPFLDFFNKFGELTSHLFNLALEKYLKLWEKYADTMLEFATILETGFSAIGAWLKERLGDALESIMKWLDMISEHSKAIERIRDFFEAILRYFGLLKDDVSDIADKITENDDKILNGGSTSTITITMNNDYTFNGADRQNQLNAAQAMEDSAEDVSDQLKIALYYGG